LKVNNLRKYYAVAAILIIATGTAALFKYNIKSYLVDDYYERSQEPVLSILSRKGDSLSVLPANITHCAVVWKSTSVRFDTKPLQKLMASHDVLITVETWLKGPGYNKNVLTEITKGKFDGRINQLGGLLSKSKHQVFVRFNPDMEVPAYVYPWQLQSPLEYTNTFNYFAQKIKQLAPNAKIVWGPSGYPGDTEYWPGNENVDFVSITLGSVSEYSTNAYPFAATVPEMLRLKMHRLRFINKPVLLLGSTQINTKTFKSSGLTTEASLIRKFSGTIYSPANYVDGSKTKPVRKVLKIGVFDPNKRLLNQPEITVEHIFTDWGEVQRGEFEPRFQEIINRHHDVIVTMEPWRDSSGQASRNTLQSTLTGQHDADIRKLFQAIGRTQQTVYLRWMHEMEIPIHRYAWQSQDPVLYINTYRYFMQFKGGPPANVKKVWGPAGDRGSIDFWPGSDVVDYISIAIYGLPDKNIVDPNKQEAFSTIFKRKYHRMRFADKPLFITEFGVKGPETYQNSWLKDAASTIKANPHIFGINYFNLYDNPKAWGRIKAPDWSISPKSMKQFCSLINE
jgi:beta-mannanase